MRVLTTDHFVRISSGGCHAIVFNYSAYGFARCRSRTAYQVRVTILGRGELWEVRGGRADLNFPGYVFGSYVFRNRLAMVICSVHGLFTIYSNDRGPKLSNVYCVIFYALVGSDVQVDGLRPVQRVRSSYRRDYCVRRGNQLAFTKVALRGNGFPAKSM